MSSWSSTRRATRRRASSTQRGQVLLGEEALESDAGGVRPVDVAVAHPLAERVGAHIDELDLVDGRQRLVRDPLPDRRPGDRLDRVGQRFKVLDVQGAHDVDPGGPDDLDVLPALLPWRSRGIGVRELVDQGNGGSASQDGVDIHLLDRDTPMLHDEPRDDLEAVEQRGGLGPAMGLDEANDHVGAPPLPPMPLLQHAVRLADARRHPDVHPEPAAAAPGPLLGLETCEQAFGRRAAVESVGVVHAYRRHLHCSAPSRSRLTSRTLTRGWPMKPRRACVV